jgi:hypothetical protein
VRNYVALIALVTLGCGDEAGPDGDAGTALDARVLDAGSACLDAGSACAEEKAYLAAHRGCSTDSDCVIVGSCSGGFGFEAVEVSAKERAQQYSDQTSCGQVFDGPTFHAVCEQGRCSARGTGWWCGGPLADAGIPGRCSPDEEQYVIGCDAAIPTCAKRCTGAGDTRCGGERSCEQTQVSAATPPYGLGCGNVIDVWLCQ